MTRRATLFIVVACGVLLALAVLAVQAFSGNGAGGALLPLSPQTSAAPVDYVAQGDRLAAERQFDSAAASYRMARDAAPADPALTRKLIDQFPRRPGAGARQAAPGPSLQTPAMTRGSASHRQMLTAWSIGARRSSAAPGEITKKYGFARLIGPSEQ